MSNNLQQDFEAVIQVAFTVSEDLGHTIEDLLKVGRERPLQHSEAVDLLNKVLGVLKRSAEARGDTATSKELEGNLAELVARVMRIRKDMADFPTPTTDGHRVALQTRNGIKVAPIFPKPTFHEREIVMYGGFVKTTDIELWNENVRLDVHVAQFEQQHGRKPNPQEMLDIMLGDMPLAGVEEDDQFKIVDLARSIANNGVRKPPIIDVDGTLLDGNRRLTACHYILNSEEFDSKQKERAQYIYVWQLTEHATADERQAVIVSLNFEPDCKQDWPEYVKARKVYEAWQTMLALEVRPGAERLRDLRKALSKRFGYGPDTSRVTRYLKMVEWADEFEEYHKNVKKRQEFEVKHKASKYFQYFDELGKGTNRGVAQTLNQDDTLKHVVFDLLYDDKFRNWTLIRNLRYSDDEVKDALIAARDEKDRERAEDTIEDALTEARNRNRESRMVGANTRIQIFVDWIEALPISAFRDQIRPENLQRLLKALKLVEHQATTVLGRPEPKT